PYAGHWAIAADILVSGLLLLVPCVLMGGTLPLLTQALAQDAEDAGPLHARIYTLNTAGAFFGCLVAGFVLLPEFSLWEVIYGTAVVNLVCGGALLFVIRIRRIEASGVLPLGENAKDKTSGARQSVCAILLAFLAGFYAITLEVVLIRVICLVMGSSEYAFSMVVACFIAMLALGAWRIAGTRQALLPLWVNQLLAGTSAVLVYLSISLWPYGNHVLRCLFTPVLPAFYVYYAAAFLVLCSVLVVPIGAMGATMPLLFRDFRLEMKSLGAVVGRLYGANALGCVCGAIGGGYLLLYVCSLDEVFQLCLLLLLLSAAIAAMRSSMVGALRRVTVVLITAAAIGVFFLPRWDRRRLDTGLFRDQSAEALTFAGPQAFYADYLPGTEIIADRDDPNTTVTVAQRRAGSEARELNHGADVVRNLRVNGKSDGETDRADMDTMRLIGHLPVLLSVKPVVDAAVIGFGLGVTAGSIAMYPEVERVDVIEISSAVRDVAPYFDFANYAASRNAKINWHIGDAYRVLGASKKKYSMIAAEPSNPWVIGVERLYSREFYELAKSRLETGGIYVQWMHLYEISPETWGMVVNSFGQAFREVRMFYIDWDVIMLGSDFPIGEAALEALAKRYSALPDVRTALAEIDVAGVESLLAAEIWLPKEMFLNYGEQTLLAPKLAFAAGKDFFLGEDLELEKFAEKPFHQPFLRRYSTKALIGLWLRRQGQEYKKALREFAKAACKQREAFLFPGWRHSRFACRHSLGSLVMIGEIPGDAQIGEAEQGLLRLLIGVDGAAKDKEKWTEFASTLPVKEAAKFVELFRRFDSPFIPLSVSNLLGAVAPCLTELSAEALNCRTDLIEALALSGYGNLSRALLGQLL
ncbi:MAG TPA: hypothetical protein PLP17_05965, partial [Oligoflexia bacterium]|nr:hypothetical protein [Oligoflexia bacterium]